MVGADLSKRPAMFPRGEPAVLCSSDVTPADAITGSPKMSRAVQWQSFVAGEFL